MELPTTFTAVDFETLGLVPMYDAPTSLACAYFKDGELNQTFQTKIKVGPQAKFSLKAFAVQSGSLDLDSLESHLKDILDPDAPTIIEASKALGEWATEFPAPLYVAHNAPFDWGFYSEHVLKCTKSFITPPLGPVWCCTKQLAWEILGVKCSLDDLVERFGFERSAGHDSLEDAILCGRAYLELRKML